MCGEIGLAPRDFYALQYSELALILEGYQKRRIRELKDRREESAWAVSWLLQPHRGKDADPITPDLLMGRKPRKKPAPKFATPGESAGAFFAAYNAKSKRGVKNA